MEQRMRKLEFEMGEKEMEGIYSNMVLITHSSHEFILDFARMMPGLKKAKVYARIIMTPQHAKSLLLTLEDNIKKYEEKFSKIEMKGYKDSKIGFAPGKKE